MDFFDVLKKRKILFLNIFLFLYIVFNLLTGERGVMAYFEKSELEKKLTNLLIQLKKNLTGLGPKF